MLLINKKLGFYRVLSCLCVWFLSVSCQYQSCSEYFGYRYDRGVYGVISFKNICPVNSLWVRASFAIPGRLPSSYVGSIEPLSSEICLHPYFNKTTTVQYMVNFPVTTPLPQLVALTVNSKAVCVQSTTGFRGVPVITQINLQHVLSIKSESDGFANVFYIPPPPPNDSGSTLGNNRGPWAQNTEDMTFKAPLSNTENGPITSTDQGMGTDTPQGFDLPSITTTSSRSQPTRCGITDVSPTVTNDEFYTYKKGEWPWVVAIYKKFTQSLRYNCLGTLVSDKHVITVAHCTRNRNNTTSAEDIIVRVGVYDLKGWQDDSFYRSVEIVRRHEMFDHKVLKNDIAVLILKKTVPLGPYIKPICLWSGDTNPNNVVGSTGFLAGWGGHDKDEKQEPIAIRMPIVSLSQCRASNKIFFALTSSTTLCAGSRNGSGPCIGDSGGGLYIFNDGRWTLRGILSIGLQSYNNPVVSCDLDEFMVFTDSAQYLPWLRGIIENKSI